MFIKIVRGYRESLYPAEYGPLDYGTQYLYEDPLENQEWLSELQAKTNAVYTYYLIFNEEPHPAGYRNFIDPENHPEEHGKPWWMVRWVSYEDRPNRPDGNQTTKALLVTFGNIYILGDNGKTIDRVPD